MRKSTERLDYGLPPSDYRSWDEVFQKIDQLQFSSPETVDVTYLVEKERQKDFKIRAIEKSGFTGLHSVCGRYFMRDKPPTKELIKTVIEKHLQECSVKSI